jgi:putative membrane protein
MLGFIISAGVSAVAIAATAYLLPQISYGDDLQTLILVAVIFGLVNGLIRPIVKLLALPVRMMTFGLIGFVINAGLLLLVAFLADQAGLTFTVGGFPPDITAETLGVAVIGAAIISAVTTAVNLIIPG